MEPVLAHRKIWRTRIVPLIIQDKFSRISFVLEKTTEMGQRQKKRAYAKINKNLDQEKDGKPYQAYMKKYSVSKLYIFRKCYAYLDHKEPAATLDSWLHKLDWRQNKMYL